MVKSEISIADCGETASQRFHFTDILFRITCCSLRKKTKISVSFAYSQQRGHALGRRLFTFWIMEGVMRI